MGKMVGSIGKNLIGGIIGGALLDGVFGGKKAPAPQQKTLMPDADSEAVRRAKRRSVAEQVSRDGRDSTILNDDSDTLGG